MGLYISLLNIWDLGSLYLVIVAARRLLETPLRLTFTVLKLCVHYSARVCFTLIFPYDATIEAWWSIWPNGHKQTRKAHNLDELLDNRQKLKNSWNSDFCQQAFFHILDRYDLIDELDRNNNRFFITCPIDIRPGKTTEQPPRKK